MSEAQGKPRKEPKQKRSKSLVISVVEATARILDLAGYARMSTNKVAEIAGVSIGSLYQYFPSKDALVVAVLERQVTKSFAMVEERVVASSHLPIEERIDMLVKSAVDHFLDNARISRELFNHGGRLQKIDFILSVRRRVVAMVARILEPDLGKDAELRAFVAINAVMGVVMTALLDQENQISREEMTRELSRMTKSYILA